MKLPLILTIIALGCTHRVTANPNSPALPLPTEKNGYVTAEAEHYVSQEKNEQRFWHVVSAETLGKLPADHDEPHLQGASGGAYLEALPDTRITPKDKLLPGENFTNRPGTMAVLHYRVRFTTPGRYFVWVRCFATGTEDNGIHVGLNGTWPESGQRWQTTQKNRWHWESRQRTEANHLGEPGLLYLDIPSAGEHTISFSMREDGFEFDRWALTINAGHDSALAEEPVAP